MLGGFGEEKDADDVVKKMANDMKEAAEKALGEKYTTFEAVKYSTQIVNGTNYKIKVKVGDENYIHIKVYVPLPAKKAPNQLIEQEKGKKLNDPL